MQSLNEKQFQKLCDASDTVLTDDGVTMERVSITWLHVLRAHPFFLKKYFILFESSNTSCTKLKLAVKKIIYCLVWLWKISKAIFVKNVESFSQGQCEKTDVLFISHLLNVEQLLNKNDFYYGDIEEKLSQQGYSGYTALINHTNIRNTNKVLSENNIRKYVFSNILSIKHEIRIFKKLRSAGKKVLSIKSEPQSFNQIFYKHAAAEALSQSSAFNLRMSYQLLKLINKLKVKSVVLTYEGHAWERVMFSTIREANPDIKIIAYQHSVLFYRQHALFQDMPKKFKPDYVLTTGKPSKKQLQNSTVYSDISVSMLGSGRTLSFKENKEVCENKNTCLVLPEGIMDECKLLFQFSLICAKEMRDFKFIWRLHPSVNFDSLLKEIPGFKNLPKNIVLSNLSIEEDIKRSSWGLYRGSTAIIQSIVSGLSPIYLERKGEMSIDPLHEVSNKIEKVSCVNDFRISLKKYNFESYLSKEVIDYCKDIYQPYNIKSLVNIIQ